MNSALLFSFTDFINNDPSLTFGDKVLGAAMVLLIGLLTVFSVLILLWIALILFKLVFHNMGYKKKAKPISEENSAPVQAPVASRYDEEVVAAIAAAIAMAESESDGIKFRVVSFRRR